MYLLIRLYPLVEWYIYRLPTKLRENKVFIGAYLFTKWGGGSPSGHYPWCLGSHPHPPRTSDLGPPATNIGRPTLKTCSNLFTWGPPLFEWHLVVALRHVRFASGRYASYWNAFLSSSYSHVTDITFVYLSVVCRLVSQYCETPREH